MGLRRPDLEIFVHGSVRPSTPRRLYSRGFRRFPGRDWTIVPSASDQSPRALPEAAACADGIGSAKDGPSWGDCREMWWFKGSHFLTTSSRAMRGIVSDRFSVPACFVPVAVNQEHPAGARGVDGGNLSRPVRCHYGRQTRKRPAQAALTPAFIGISMSTSSVVTCSPRSIFTLTFSRST